MITQPQLVKMAKIQQINETIVLREYFQVWFLSRLYSQKGAESLFFKGGTAIRLIFGGSRFSEDLDFTTLASEHDTRSIIEASAADAEKEMGLYIEKKESLAGISYRLTSHSQIVTQPVYIRIDVSIREPVIQPEKTVLTTTYPVLFTQFIHHPSRNEIVAEKIRALLTREKGRDLYDLWYLFQLGAAIDPDLVNTKLALYKRLYDPNEVIRCLDSFSKKAFLTDLGPFVPLTERLKLEDFYDFVLQAIRQQLIEK